MQERKVSVDDFERLFQTIKNRQCDLYARAKLVFDNFGTSLSFSVTSILLYATDKGAEKLEEVLMILEQHWNDDLQHQRSEISGRVFNSSGANRTQSIFSDIYQRVLNIQPDASQQDDREDQPVSASFEDLGIART